MRWGTRHKKLLDEDRETIAVAARTLRVCAVLAGEDIKDEVEALYEKVLYLSPSATAHSLRADRRIGALAGDLRIALSSGGNGTILGEIKIALAERE